VWNSGLSEFQTKKVTLSPWISQMDYPQKNYHFKWVLLEELLFIYFCCTYLVYFCLCGPWVPFWVIVLVNEQPLNTKSKLNRPTVRDHADTNKQGLWDVSLWITGLTILFMQNSISLWVVHFRVTSPSGWFMDWESAFCSPPEKSLCQIKDCN